MIWRGWDRKGRHAESLDKGEAGKAEVGRKPPDHFGGGETELAQTGNSNEKGLQMEEPELWGLGGGRGTGSLQGKEGKAEERIRGVP